MAGCGYYLSGNSDRRFFITPGLYKLIGWFVRDRKHGEDTALFPVDAIGSVLFGGWLILMPAFFVSIVMYVLGVLLLLAGGYQLLWLFRIHKQFTVSWFFFVFPSLIVLAGIFILAYPFATATTTFMVFGATSVVYGISELVNSYKFGSGKY